MSLAIEAGDVAHLEVLERGPFAPIGWLYGGIYERLQERSLAVRRAGNFYLSPYGAEQLRKFRESGGAA